MFNLLPGSYIGCLKRFPFAEKPSQTAIPAVPVFLVKFRLDNVLIAIKITR